MSSVMAVPLLLIVTLVFAGSTAPFRRSLMWESASLIVSQFRKGSPP